jgi:hypothetical protein
MQFKMKQFSGTSKFIAGVIAGAMLFSGSAIALNNYVSDNTPENGYLLCANLKTKAVTFPNKLSCPSGTKALDLGAVTGVEGPAGQQGPQGLSGPQGPAGLQGPAGKDGSGLPGYLVSLKKQDVLASLTSKTERAVISKSGFKSGYYTITSEVAMLFQNSNQQVALCNVKTTGNSQAYSAFPSHEVANTWTGYTAQFTGLLYVSSSQDLISISCSFTGNTQLIYGYLLLTPTVEPQFSDSN